MYTRGRALWFIISDSFLQKFPNCIQLGNPISNVKQALLTRQVSAQNKHFKTKKKKPEKDTFHDHQILTKAKARRKQIKT